MHKRKFTVFTQLHEENNADLIEYFDDRRKRQSKVVRETFLSSLVLGKTSSLNSQLFCR